MAKLAGGCACGAIRYEVQADPVAMLNCHCRDCQRGSGTAYGAFLAVPKGAVEVRGEPRYYRTVGRAGRVAERGFCVTCGSPVMMKLERVIALHASSLDDPSVYRPAMDIFTESAHAWDHMGPTTQKLPGGLPA